MNAKSKKIVRVVCFILAAIMVVPIILTLVY